MVGSYSANDLAAILGAMPGAGRAFEGLAFLRKQIASTSGGAGGGAALHGVSAGRPGSPSSSEDEDDAGCVQGHSELIGQQPPQNP
eukprot:1145536-Pelagomonas_calceolata.AAC.5